MPVDKPRPTRPAAAIARFEPNDARLGYPFEGRGRLLFSTRSFVLSCLPTSYKFFVLSVSLIVGAWESFKVKELGRRQESKKWPRRHNVTLRPIFLRFLLTACRGRSPASTSAALSR